MAPIVNRFFLSRDLCTVFEHLAEKCAYLIHVRGYAAWTP